jgi:hypothetical protein
MVDDILVIIRLTGRLTAIGEETGQLGKRDAKDAER